MMTGEMAELRDFAARVAMGPVRRADGPATRLEEWADREGQITKLKLLERQIYGRESVVLLRQDRADGGC